MSLRALSHAQTGVDLAAPLDTLYHSHETIVGQLSALAALPGLLEQAEQARRVAADALALFGKDVLQHHQDEEKALFPAVQASAAPGEESDTVQTLASQLTAEHRTLEQLWKSLEPAVRSAAAGRTATLDAALLARLVHTYTAHARFEEQRFLPLAQAILGRNHNHLGAVGVDLHMRRLPDLPGYI